MSAARKWELKAALGAGLSNPAARDAVRELCELYEAEIAGKEMALRNAIRIAEEARREWDAAPEGMKAGKLLIALSGSLPGYRPDIDAIHAALTPAAATAASERANWSGEKLRTENTQLATRLALAEKTLDEIAAAYETVTVKDGMKRSTHARHNLEAAIIDLKRKDWAHPTSMNTLKRVGDQLGRIEYALHTYEQSRAFPPAAATTP